MAKLNGRLFQVSTGLGHRHLCGAVAADGGNKVNLKKTLPDQSQYRTDIQTATNRQSNGFTLQKASSQKMSWLHLM